MSRKLKIGLAVLGALLLLVLAAPFFLNADQFRPLLEAEASKALGRKVTIGKLSLSLTTGKVGADEIEIAEDPAFGQTPFVRAAGFRAGVQVMPLIQERKLLIDSVELIEPQVSLVQTADLRWNYSSLGSSASKTAAGQPDAPPGQSLDGAVKLLRMTKGKVTIKQAGGDAEGLTVDQLDLEARDLSAQSVMPMKLSGALPGGGRFVVDGTVGPLVKRNTELTPVEAKLSVEKLNMAQARAVKGLGGLANYTGSLSSKDGVARLRGQLTVQGLQVGANAKPAARAIDLAYNLTHDLKTHSGSIAKSAVRAGKAQVQFGARYQLQPRGTKVTAHLEGEGMPLDDLVALLPAFGVVLPQGATLQGGALTLGAWSGGTTPAMISKGRVTLVDSTLTGYSLGAAVTKAASLIGLSVGPNTVIERLQADFENSAEGTRLSDVQMVVQGLGTVTGEMTLDAAQNLNGQLTAKIQSKGGLTGVGLRKLGGSGEMQLDVPITISGTASNPVVKADSKAVAGQAVRTAAKSAVEKYVQGDAGKAVGSILGGFLNRKKKQ